MKRFRGIIKSNKEPEDKELIWLNQQTDEVSYFEDGFWVPLVRMDAASITLDGKSLESIIKELTKVNLSASFSVLQKGPYLQGKVISQLDFSWSYNKSIKWQKINGKSISPMLRKITLDTPISETTVFTLEASDGETTVQKSIEITFIDYETSKGVVTVQTEADLSTIENPEVGNIAYVEAYDQLYIYNTKGQWSTQFGGSAAILVQDEAPDRDDVIWIDLSGDGIVNEDGNLSAIREDIKTIQESIRALNYLLEYGIVAGNSEVGGRTQMMATSELIKPEASEYEDEEEDENQYKPIVPDSACTIPNISIKVDTSENFMNNRNNLIDGEPIFITDLQQFAIYYNGAFVISSSEGGGNITSGIIDKASLKENLEDIELDSLNFNSSNGNTYKFEIDYDGNPNIYNTASYSGTTGSPGSYGSYISDYLKINSVFIGGIGTRLDTLCACSHNYVELANGSTNDINLNGLYLLYRVPDGSSWSALELHGKIKAGSTYLIRGARCSYSCNVTIDIADYDVQWYSDGKLIEFDEGGGTFYLVCSQDGKFHNGTDWVSLSDFGGVNPYQATAAPVGYVDLLGILGNKGGTVNGEGGSPIAIKSTEDMKKCVFTRSFTLDPCSQAQKAYTAKKSSTLCTYFNMDTQASEAYPYYSNEDKFKFLPKASKDEKTIYGTRTTFDSKKPNAINVTFGIQATDNGTGATKCFNWVSVGKYDEFIEYRLKGGSINSKESISLDNYKTTYADDSNVQVFIDIYKRIHWLSTNNTVVTTHKVILRNLKAGEYEFRICRSGDESYTSEWKTFIVRTDEEVNNYFEFVHTTDQQSFNFYEYQAWTKAAFAIKEHHPNVHFIVNTGDATQNGNRENEWLDYFKGREQLPGIEEMYSIGNNDLCGIIPYTLGDGTANTYKINHRNILYYYCFELDTFNPAIFRYIDSNLEARYMNDVLEYSDTYFTYYMPSLYSFNYGKYHFVSLNSEFANKTYRCYYDDANKETSFKAHAFYCMYKWMVDDYNRYGQDRNTVVFTHEIPFCITVANASTAIGTARTLSSGSKLNEDFTAGIAKTDYVDDSSKYVGGCCFSEFFQEHNIKLCLGGHKHTYSLSYPTTENIYYEDGVRKVKYNEPLINQSNGVVYAMSQATGYKLVSNKELPGSGISWLRKYFPATSDGTSLTANEAQYYPMYSHFKVEGNSVGFTSYAVANIYTRNSKNKPVAFDINNQSTDFSAVNSQVIDNTQITIDY
jgi:Calcineurin-like phosphoesterase